MQITLGSTSTHKLDAVRRACHYLGKSTYQITCVEVIAPLNEQPVGFEEIYRGAFYRASRAIAGKNCIGIGIEIGLIRFNGLCLEGITLDLAVIVVLCPDGKEVISTSPAVQFPEVYVKIAEDRGFESTTVGQIIQAQRGGSFNDPHSTMTDGNVSRVDTLVAGLIVALRQI